MKKETTIQTKTMSTVTTKNLVLEGVKNLRAEKVTSTFKVTYNRNPKTGTSIQLSRKLIKEKREPLCFRLSSVTAEQLQNYRTEGVSSFVLKIDGRLYHTEIPKNISFVGSDILGSHKCGYCNRLSSASDEEGGCEKVRKFSHCIEKFPWITQGYETFNTNHDSFRVCTCLNHEEFPPRRNYTVKEKTRLKLGLAQFIWDDVRTFSDIQRRME